MDNNHLLAIKKRVYEANLEIIKRGLAPCFWGNCSEIDRETNCIVIKPSGCDLNSISFEDMVVVDIATGNTVNSRLKPSTDTLTHIELYKFFPNIGGVVHSHSPYATSFAQAGCSIAVLGTTQADYFKGNIPCTKDLSDKEIRNEYEQNTGKLIVKTFNELHINPNEIPGVLVKNHGPFVWGNDANEALLNATVMEEIAKMNILSLQLNSDSFIKPELVKKHFYRKHGENAYYGQK